MAQKAELVPLSELGDFELAEVAVGIYQDVSKFEVRRMLVARHLKGVIARHTVSPRASVESLKAARSTDPSELSAFVAYPYGKAAVSGESIGIATLQPELPLHRQRVRLPVALSRNRLISEDVSVKGPNVSGWISGCDQNLTELKGMMQSIYAQLYEMSPDGVWTIEPVSAPFFVHAAIERAGFGTVDTGYYDDLEEPGRSPHLLPLMRYYAAPHET